MNNALVLLYSIVIIFIFTTIIFCLLSLNKWNKQNIIVVPNGIEKCTIPLDNSSLDVSNLECCVLNSNITPFRYSHTLDMVISPVSKYNYLEICRDFCILGIDDKNPTLCVDGQGQEKYTNCLNITKPNKCSGKSTPVGYSGITYFYGYISTKDSCPLTRECGT